MLVAGREVVAAWGRRMEAVLDSGVIAVAVDAALPVRTVGWGVASAARRRAGERVRASARRSFCMGFMSYEL